MSNAPRRKRRRRKAVKRFDMTDMCKALEDMGFVRGFLTCLGIVQAADDGGVHFDLDGEDLTVEVQLQPSLVEMTVRVGTVAGGSGAGIWRVPPVGTEVLVAVPDGDLDFQPVISSWYSTGSLPSDISESVLVIAAPPGGEVYIHDGSGSVEPLVKKSEFDSHTHPTGVGPSGVPAPVVGTAVLKAK